MASYWDFTLAASRSRAWESPPGLKRRLKPSRKMAQVFRMDRPLAYMPTPQWRNHSEFVNGRQEIVGFLTLKWSKEDYRLIKESVLNSLMQLTRAGGSLGIPGLYVTDDPGGIDQAAKTGSLSIRLGLGWP